MRSNLFVLPGFRERTFPGREGRLRSEPFVDTDREPRTNREQGGIESTTRYGGRTRLEISTSVVAHFHGTSREPLLLPECATASCNPVTGQGLVLAPRYEVVRRTSLDVQATRDAMLWKLEALHESRQGNAYVAWIAGLEHTWYGFFDSDLDLGLLVEHLFDGRGGHAPQPLENDVFAGVRLALNDEASTDLVTGIIVDAEGDATTLNLEASRRIGDLWKVELQALIWTGVDPDDSIFPFQPRRLRNNSRCRASGERGQVRNGNPGPGPCESPAVDARESKLRAWSSWSEISVKRNPWFPKSGGLRGRK